MLGLISGQSPLVTQRWQSSVPQEGEINQDEQKIEVKRFLFIPILSQFYKFSILTVIPIIHFSFFMAISESETSHSCSYGSDPPLSFISVSSYHHYSALADK